jgi:hypothetical protein
LATYRQHRLQITSTNGRWLLETDVSIIDSTPQTDLALAAHAQWPVANAGL